LIQKRKKKTKVLSDESYQVEQKMAGDPRLVKLCSESEKDVSRFLEVSVEFAVANRWLLDAFVLVRTL
jgi:hypothetical protein